MLVLGVDHREKDFATHAYGESELAISSMHASECLLVMGWACYRCSYVHALFLLCMFLLGMHMPMDCSRARFVLVCVERQNWKCKFVCFVCCLLVFFVMQAQTSALCWLTRGCQSAPPNPPKDLAGQGGTLMPTLVLSHQKALCLCRLFIIITTPLRK